MNKKRVALALAAALGINTLMVTVGNVAGQTQIAHAQSARLTGDQVKLLEGVKIKSLATEVEISSTGEPALTFTDIKKENIKNVKVTEAFKHTVFTERKGIDSEVTSTINGTWDSSTGKLKLSSKITQPGIYTGKVEIELNDGTKETYTVSLRKTPSDSLSFGVDVKVGTIEIDNLKLNNGAGDVANFTPKKVAVSLNGGTEKEVTATSGKYTISALDLTSNGKLKEGDILAVRVEYGTGNEYSLSGEVAFVGAEKKEVTNAFVSNDSTGFAKLATTVEADFGVTGAGTGTFAAGNNKYNVTADGKTLFTYEQTVFGTGNVALGAPLTVDSKSNSSISLTIGNATTQSTAAGNAGFVPNATISYATTNGTNGIIGDYTITIDGQTTTYFDAVGSRIAAKKISNNEAFLEYQQPVGTTSNLTQPGAITPTVKTHKVDVNFDKLGHGYTPVAIDFGVNAVEDIKNVEAVNESIANDTTAGLTTRTPAKVTENMPQVTATLVVVTDTLDGAYAQAKFEQTSASEGKITLVGGKKVVGTLTDLNTVRLNVGGATANIIGAESNGNDLVFSVQFNGQVPTTIDWTLGVGSTSKVKGTLETGVLESTNIKSVKATNSGTSNIKDQFTVEAQFNLTFPNSTTKVTVDDSTSDRVTLDQFKTGEHTVNVKSETGKYQGTYKAGVMVTQQPFAIEVKDAKSTSNTSASLVVDANFFNTADIAKVEGGVIQYSEKTVNGNTTTWSDWKDSTKIEKSEVKEDAITKTVTGLTGGKTYKFRAVYDYKNGNTTEKVYSTISGEVTLPTSSSSSTITGNGSSSTTTGTSTGSTTISVNTNNSTLSGTSASVKLPSGFRYDSGKTPVAISFKYKDKDGKVVTETKEQFSNVTVKFNGDNVEVNGLVPGKNYDEITVDYTDNNGRTRSIILRNIQTSTTVESDKYLANVYTVVFDRPADEAGYHFHLDNLKNKRVSLREFLLNMLSEKEFIEKYKSTEQKVEALYSAIVARSSDEAGKKFWVEEYNKALKVYGSESTALRAIADRMVNENELKELADKMGVQW